MPALAVRAGLTALAASLSLSLAGPALAQEPEPIEAVWSFSGGQIAVERDSSGTQFTGTVIRRTQLAECPHPVGEKMWTEVVRQPDGQYFGRHQYFRVSGCTPLSRPRVAMRVLTRPEGTAFLRICFSDPDQTPDVDEQPSIAPDGTESNTNDGCLDSDLVSPLPKAAPKLADIVKLPPSPKGCASRRAFPIRLKEPLGDALKNAKITLGSKRLRVVRSGGRLRSVVDLRGLARGRYTLKIVAKTVRGRTISGTRKYRTCGKKKRIGNVGPI